jgi:hypothetical protein
VVDLVQSVDWIVGRRRMDLVFRRENIRIPWMVPMEFVVVFLNNIRWMDQNRHKNHHTHPEVVVARIATMSL